MYVKTLEIVNRANEIVKRCETRDPYKIADMLGINVMQRNFKVQKGAYKVILRNRFIFISGSLSPVMEKIVLLHEIGHDTLHRAQALRDGGFHEFNIFDMRNLRMEYEANVFASQIALDDDEFIANCEKGYDIQQIASVMNSDINLVALKIDTLRAQGYKLRQQEHNSEFLK